MKNLERLEFFKDIDFSNIPEFDVQPDFIHIHLCIGRNVKWYSEHCLKRKHVTLLLFQRHTNMVTYKPYYYPIVMPNSTCQYTKVNWSQKDHGFKHIVE